jgi:putative ABC transport system permease protein
MLMFVFEAVIQGVVGGLIGIVLGILLAVLRGFVEYGTLIFGAGEALGDVVLATVLSLVVGVLLAAFAAVGPSWVAARLAPMEAMRVE